MKDLLNNAWFVGIATGLLSGLLVTWILNLFIAKRRRLEFRQQVDAANREVIFTIRSSIPEGPLPTHEVVMALIHSTARRYGLKSIEIYQPPQITEELVKEVMDSSFLASAKKAEYCRLLMPLAVPTPVIQIDRKVDSDSSPVLATTIQTGELSDARTDRMIRFSSVAAATGAVVAVITSYLSIKGNLPSMDLVTVLPRLKSILAEVMKAVVFAAITVFALQHFVSASRSSNSKKDELADLRNKRSD